MSAPCLVPQPGRCGPGCGLQPVLPCILDVPAINGAGCECAGLTAAMYLRDGQEVPNPDPDAGLYIRKPSGEVVQARIPQDHLAFQMGEAMQVG